MRVCQGALVLALGGISVNACMKFEVVEGKPQGDGGEATSGGSTFDGGESGSGGSPGVDLGGAGAAGVETSGGAGGDVKPRGGNGGGDAGHAGEAGAGGTAGAAGGPGGEECPVVRPEHRSQCETAGLGCSYGWRECDCVASHDGGFEWACSGHSCDGMAGDECQGYSCCTSILVPGGTYNRDGDPEYPATVSDFYLDKYEVTVGRFRAFVADYDRWISTAGGSHPQVNEGEHVAGYGSGWLADWNTGEELPASSAVLTDTEHLKCNSTYQTWTDTAEGANETRAINCVNWYAAFAFCIWDGGRLPTEAEWEYAAGCGAENRLYPWGFTAPNCALANYSGCAAEVDLVGRSGAGCWEHEDLAGNVWEWNFDWYATPYSNLCSNCTNLTATTLRVMRGGVFSDDATYLRATYRDNYYPTNPHSNIGFRCSRTP